MTVGSVDKFRRIAIITAGRNRHLPTFVRNAVFGIDIYKNVALAQAYQFFQIIAYKTCKRLVIPASVPGIQTDGNAGNIVQRCLPGCCGRSRIKNIRSDIRTAVDSRYNRIGGFIHQFFCAYIGTVGRQPRTTEHPLSRLF